MGLISLTATTPCALAQVAGDTDLVAFQTEVSEEQAREAGVVGTHTLRFSRVAIDPELLRLPGPEDSPPGTWLNTGGSHAIEPFEGERYTVRGRRVEASDDGTWSWVGQVEGYEHGDFVLSVYGEQVYGTLRAGPVTLEFQTGDDGWHYVREPDVDAYGGCAHTGEGHENEIGAPHRRARSPAPSLPAGVSPSRTVDVHINVLRKWIRDVEADPAQAFPGQGQMKGDQAEIAKLKREVVKLKMERDILKKAAAYFAKESM